MTAKQKQKKKKQKKKNQECEEEKEEMEILDASAYLCTDSKVRSVTVVSSLLGKHVLI